MISLTNQVGGWIWPFQFVAFKLGWIWEAIVIVLLVIIVWMGSPRITLLLPKADHGLLIFLPQADCGRQNWRFCWRFCETSKLQHWRYCWLKRYRRHCWLLWLKRFGRWWFCGTKADLSGNVQRSWWEDFWLGYSWSRHQLGNLFSKWSWQVSKEKLRNGIMSSGIRAQESRRRHWD